MSFSLFKKKRRGEGLHILSDADLIIKNPNSMLAESLKAARTNLMYTLADEEGGKALLVTSAFSAEGKTTTCINLAATLAQTDAKVLLIDADMRKPRVHTCLGVKNTEGLANHLGGFSDIDTIIKKSEFDFDYITAGNIPPNPAELLSSAKCGKFLETVKERYDYVVIDTPPVNVVADSLSISSYVKNVVFVCRCGVSITSEVKKAVSTLEFAHARILGFITIDSSRKKVQDYSKNYYYYSNNK